jgi:hypothetical protein
MLLRGDQRAAGSDRAQPVVAMAFVAKAACRQFVNENALKLVQLRTRA